MKKESTEPRAWFTIDELNAWADKKLEENPHWAERSAQQDIPDLIAGALGVSRGTAYDMMREALAEQPAPVQGWKLVPVDPTPEQIKEGNKVTWPLPCAQAYSTMLAAAPQPAQRAWVGLTDEQQIAEALRRQGLTLVKTAKGYDVINLGQITAHGIKENT